MKFSMTLASALPALALATPATMPRAASEEPTNIIDIILGNLNLPAVPMEQIEALHTCLSEHNTFQTDFSLADQGVFSISNADPACCEKAKDIWNQLPADEYGEISFSDNCDAAIVTGVSEVHMALLRSFFGSI